MLSLCASVGFFGVVCVAGLTKGGDIFYKTAHFKAPLPNLRGDRTHALINILPRKGKRLIPSVVEAAGHCGNPLWDYTMGQAARFMPVVNALVVTEIQALAILIGVTTVHVGSGGVAGSEGAVMLALEGEKEGVLNEFELVESY